MSRFGWPILHDSLVERCILRITRLVDPAQSHQGEKNTSFFHLATVLKEKHDGDFSRSFKQQVEQFKKDATPLVDQRNKVLAHADFAMAAGEKEYPVVTIGKINGLLIGTKMLCNNVREYFKEVSCDYDICVGAWARDIPENILRLQRFEAIRNSANCGKFDSGSQAIQALVGMGQDGNGIGRDNSGKKIYFAP